jgi:hypothetical protein
MLLEEVEEFLLSHPGAPNLGAEEKGRDFAVKWNDQRGASGFL